MTVLRHSIDVYKSAIITDASLTQGDCDPIEFESNLFETLAALRGKGVRGIWLQLPPKRADLVAPAVRCGFGFHSAREQLLTMTAWLPRDEESRLPPSAAHFIGVGAFVLNSKDELLVVREKTGPSARLANFWKLPGGLVDRQEDINVAACRELREETGLEAEFVSFAAIQEAHHSSEGAGPARLGTTDLYIVCVLRAKDENQPIQACETEIAEAKWMPAKDVLALPFYAAQGSVFSHMFAHAYAVAKGQAPGLEVARLRMGFLPMENNLFGAFRSTPSSSSSSKL